ncbi:MAG: tetratricopeptide repeat protein [Casimicrobiaceae bacterium]
MPDPRLAPLAMRLANGDLPAALTLANALLADAAIATPDRMGALVLRARIHEAMADRERAIVDLEGALALDGSQARIWNELGLVCADTGQAERSIAAFEHSVRTDPAYARGWNNLGNALRGAGRTMEAVRAAERATMADPAYPMAWANLGALRREVGDDGGAAVALRRALELAPNHLGALKTLGGLLRESSDLEPAAELFRRAASLDKRDASSAFLLGATLAERDDLVGAREAFAEASLRDPHLLRALLAEQLALPMIAADVAAVANARANYVKGMAILAQQFPVAVAALTPERLLDELRHANFLLAYQGDDDTTLQFQYGHLMAAAVTAGAAGWRAPLPPRVRAGSRIRVGFASAFFRDGTAGRYFEHWITGLPREEFEVFVYHLVPYRDALTQRVEARADHFRYMPWWRPSQIAPRVHGDSLDVLVYPELGMGAVTFALAALRLAPLQCAAWGHPVTTGHSAIDVYLSVAAMEPPEAARHYTESLHLLPGIGTRYPMPVVSGVATRSAVGLPAEGPLLLCAQSLFKIHPDNDALYVRILQQLPSAHLVMFEGRDPQLTARFRRRLEAAGAAADRLHFVPQCSHDDYLRLNPLCDAMLDTLHWSGGNTSLDALACGLPVVTLPGRFMRGRQSAGMLGLMGIGELVAKDADDYVRIAVRLASDRAWRDAMSARIAVSRAKIFDDVAPINAVADFLRRG